MNFCNELARSLRQSAPPALWHESGDRMIAAIEATVRPSAGQNVSLYRSDAFLVLFQLRGQLRLSFRVDDFEFRAAAFHPGTVFVLDLRRDIELVLTEPCHMLAIHVPHADLFGAAERAGVAPSLRSPHTGLSDATLTQLGLAIRETMHHPFGAGGPPYGRLFDRFLSRLATASAAPKARTRSPRRALSPREADTLLAVVQSRLTAGLTVAEAARACGLNQATLGRAFRQSIGLPLNQWLILRRLDVAMDLMLDSDKPLAKIAAESGFADQPHFTHAFSRRMGTSPSAWRRTHHGPQTMAETQT
jgi:AraC-like DNA-binding protein